MSKTVVPYYGVHWAEGGIAFLEQEKGGSNAVGLREKSPFVVVTVKRKKRCNHLIPLATPNPDPVHWDAFKGMLEQDDLVKAMIPVPHTGPHKGYYLVDRDDWLKMVLVLLSKMSSPIMPITLPIVMMMSFQQIVEELQMTNVQPLVLTGVKPAHTILVNQLAEVLPVVPRALILTGSDDVVVPPQFKRITTSLNKYDQHDLARMPWETFGAVLVRKHMRKEQI